MITTTDIKELQAENERLTARVAELEKAGQRILNAATEAAQYLSSNAKYPHEAGALDRLKRAMETAAVALGEGGRE